MKYRLKRDPVSVAQARSLLMSEFGEDALTADDGRIVSLADEMLNSMAGHLAPVRTAFRPLAEQLWKTRRGKFVAKLFGVYPPPVDVYERLHELAEERHG